MELVASRRLDRVLPDDLASVSGGVVTLASVSVTTEEEGSLLEAFDNNLTPTWCKRLSAKGLAFTAAHGATWVLDREGAWTIGEDGASLARVNLEARQGMELAACAPVADGFVFAWQHRTRTMRPPVLERVNLDSTVAWSVILPVGSVAYEGVLQMRADENWKLRPVDPWTPKTWFVTSPELKVSGDAVLACFTEMPRSGIGYGYVVSLADGMLRYTTRTGPITEVASVGNGAFLVGYQGYGAFETLLYDREGEALDQWPSHGYYLTGEDLRVLELENQLPSKMHVVRLRPGGIVDKGAWLDGYYTSRPHCTRSGGVYFFRKGAVLAVEGVSINARLALTATDDGLYPTRMVGTERCLYVAYARFERRGEENLGTNLVQIHL